MPVTTRDLDNLRADYKELEGKVDRLDRGAAAHDVMMEHVGTEVRRLGETVAAALREHREDMAALGVQLRADHRSLREKVEKSAPPWFKDFKVWGLAILGLLTAGNTTATYTQQTASPPPAVTTTAPQPVIPQALINSIGILADYVEQTHGNPPPAAVQDSGQPQPPDRRRPGARSAAP